MARLRTDDTGAWWTNVARWAYYGRGSIDCGPGFDTLRIKVSNRYSVHNCERIKNFCPFGSKPGNKGGCYEPGERPASRARQA